MRRILVLSKLKQNRLAKVLKKKPILISLLLSPVVILVFFFFAHYLPSAMRYDESYNLQVSKNISEIGGYATNGSNFFEKTNKPFDPYISTGPTLLLPIAIIFKFFGVGIIQYRVLTSVLFLVFVFLLIFIIQKTPQTDNHSMAIKSVVAVLATTLIVSINSRDLYIAAMGETLGLILFFASYLSLIYRRTTVSGIMLGLAILTKTIFVIALPAFLVAIFIVASKRKNRLRFVGQVLLALAGVMIPTILFEVYRLYSFSMNLSLYKTSVVEYITFFKTSGSGMNGSTTILSIFKDRLHELLNITEAFASVPSKIVFCFMIIFLGYSVFIITRSIQIPKRYRRLALSPSLVYLGGTVFLWFTWWFMIADIARMRHVMPALVLCILFVAIFMLRTIPNIPKRFTVIFFLYAVFFSVYVGLISKPYSGDLSTQLQNAKTIRTLYGQREMYNFYWWQNPDIQFINGSQSYLFDPANPTNKGDYWVLMSKLHQELDPSSYERDIAQCKETYDVSQTYSICVMKY